MKVVRKKSSSSSALEELALAAQRSGHSRQESAGSSLRDTKRGSLEKAAAWRKASLGWERGRGECKCVSRPRNKEKIKRPVRRLVEQVIKEGENLEREKKRTL